jgi:hypothetical protein
MRKQGIKGLIGILMFLWMTHAYTAGRAYKIEMIVFAQHDETNEVFDQYQSRIQWPATIRNLSDYSPATKSLTGIWAKLQASPSYRPILHVAWVQRVGANRLGAAVKIQSPSPHIKGYFRIQRGNLLHLIADIEYQPEDVIYRIQEKRRFKLNEIHYLDHPRFGLIVRVSPW